MVKIIGNVTMSLADYHRLQDSHNKALEQSKKMRSAAIGLEILLNDILDEHNIIPQIQTFNIRDSGVIIKFSENSRRLKISVNTEGFNLDDKEEDDSG